MIDCGANNQPIFAPKGVNRSVSNGTTRVCIKIIGFKGTAGRKKNKGASVL